MFVIRRTDDIDTIRFLERKTFPDDIPCEINGALWWVVFCEKKPIGFAGLQYYPKLNVPCAFLYRVGVLKNYRGNGLQKRLIKVREKQCLKDEYYRIVTYTHPDNISSANNLIKCGYYLYRPRYKWGLENALYFAKELL